MNLFKNTVVWSGFSLNFSVFSLCLLARTTVKDWLKPVQTSSLIVQSDFSLTLGKGLVKTSQGIIRSCSLFLFLLIFHSNLPAQDFDKDFAKSGGLGIHDSTPVKETNRSKEPQLKKSVSPQLPNETAPHSELPGVPIKKLGLIVWGEDETHLQPALYEFTKLIHTFTDIKIGDLVILGDPEVTINKLEPHLAPKNINKETIRKLVFTSIFSARAEDDEDNSKEIVDDFSKIIDQDQKLKRELSVFNNLSLVRIPPKELNITHSPAWVVTVEKGDILIEGIQNISRFINSKGELLEEELKA